MGRFAASHGNGWDVVQRSVGGAIRGDLPLSYLIAINAVTLDSTEESRFEADWMWAPRLISGAAVRELAEGWFRVLDRFVWQIEKSDVNGRTPSHTPLVSITHTSSAGS